MFLNEPTEELRQGDVCAVAALPVWDLKSTSTVSEPGGGRSLQIPAWTRGFQSADGDTLVAVCSHDCDAENARARSGLLVAPIMRIPASPAKEADLYGAIKNSATPEIDEGRRVYDFINLFPVVVPIIGDAVVDFSALVSMVPVTPATDVLLSSKQFEMTDEVRTHFREKLAAFVGRPPEGG